MKKPIPHLILKIILDDILVIFRPPSQHEEVNRRRSRTNILLACITITFFVGWAPLVIFSLIYEFAEHWLPVKSSMKSLIYALSLLSGILTPIGKVLLLSISIIY